MNRTIACSSLAWRKLLRLMAHIGFGRMFGVEVRAGEPHVTADTRIVKTVKFGSDPRTVPVQSLPSHPRVLEFARELSALQDGVIERLEIHCGLPTFMEVAAKVTESEIGHGV